MSPEQIKAKIQQARNQGVPDEVTFKYLDDKGLIPKNKIVTLEAPIAAPEQNYLQRVGSSYKKAGENIVSEVQRSSNKLASSQNGELLTIPQAIKGAGELVRTGLRTVGNVAGAAFAPILEAPGIKQGIQKIGSMLTGNSEVNQLISKVGKIAQQYPEASKDAEAILNIVTLGGGKAAYAPLKGEAKAIGQDIAGATRAALTPSEEAIQSNVQKLFQKSIKPTVKKTVAQGQRYENDTLNALKTISNNSDSLNIQDVTGEIVSGRKPQTINELAQAVDQTKKAVFKQYDDLAKQAGTGGATVDAKLISDELVQVANNKALQITNPELIKYAQDWSKRLKGFGVLDTETTQAVIQNLNNNLSAFYRNPTYDSASKVAIDAGIANNFRVALDKAIETATGKEYQVLKNQYSSLKAIENDVTRAAMRDAKRNVKGLLDYSDIFTGGQMVSGILSMNPAMFTKGAIERGFKEYFKFLNDPNRAIKNIFEQLDKQPLTQPFTPKSVVGKYIKDPKIGLSIKPVKDLPSNFVPSAVAKKMNSADDTVLKQYIAIPKELQSLAQEAKKYKTPEEFVKAQGNPLYHGSPYMNRINTEGFKLGRGENLVNAWGRGVYLAENKRLASGYSGLDSKGGGIVEAYIPKDLKLYKAKAKDAYMLKNEELIKKGYGGVVSETGGGNTTITIFDPSVIKTKSQLTDIWKKANKK